ncbi:Obp56d.2 family protein [Megaselia abdita]
MRTIIVALFLTLVVDSFALNPAQMKLLEAYGVECAAKHGVTGEFMTALRGGDFSQIDNKGKCFINCVLEKSAVMKGGVLQVQVAADKLSLDGSDKTKVSKLVDSCKTTKGSDECDTSYKLFECYMKNKF